MQRETLHTSVFALSAYSRIARRDLPIHVYIERDGFAWVTRSEPSQDPTPREATGLALAAADPSPNVMYLARPCQYTPMPENPRCDVRYWTSARFAPDVLVSMNEAMDAIAARAPGPGVDLVGYSGGGATTYRRCPSRSIQSMSRLPSVRCRKCNSPATRDYVVSLAVARRFVHAVGTDCARWRAVADVAHDGDWAHIWPALLEAPVSCKGE